METVNIYTTQSAQDARPLPLSAEAQHAWESRLEHLQLSASHCPSPTVSVSTPPPRKYVSVSQVPANSLL